MEFTDFRELKKLMAQNTTNEFEFETGHEEESYQKHMMQTYAN